MMDRQHHINIVILAASLALGWCTTALADTRYTPFQSPSEDTKASAPQQSLYKVELVVFANENETDPDALDLVHLQNDNYDIAHHLQFHSAANNYDNTSDDISNALYELLPSSQFSLIKEEQSIAHKDHFKILLHIAWQQPLQKTKFARPIYIAAGNAYDAEGNIIGSSDLTGNNMSAPASLWEFEGTITLAKNNFFEINSDLHLNEIEKASFFSSQDFHVKSYHMQQQRRMTSNELNYLDHPKFGVLLLVSPVSLTS